MNKNNLINIAGSIWVIVGTFLVYRGWKLYRLAADEQNSTETAIMISVVVGVIVGIVKGKFILSKTARRNRDRIESLESPVKIFQVFSKRFYGFIFGMMLLGVLLRTQSEYFGGYVVVAAIYCGVGAALIVSSLVYWKDQSKVI